MSQIPGAAMAQQEQRRHTDGCDVGHGPSTNHRELTARERMEYERDEAIARAQAINDKIKSFDETFGKQFLEVPENMFRQRFSLDIYCPF